MLVLTQCFSRFVLLAIILAAFALFVTALPYQDIWWDEARNIDVALRPLTQIATAPELDIHPPLYFWLLHWWSRIAGIAMAHPPEIIAYIVRFFSVLGGTCAVALLYPIARRLHSPQAGQFACLIATTSPFWLAESQETRMYTLSFAFLTAAAWFLLRIISPPAQPQRAHATAPLTINYSRFIINYCCFTLLSTAALLTHYNTVFVLAVWYAWWMMVALLNPDRWQQVRGILICGIATTILFLPVVPIALRQIPTYANPNLIIPTVGDYLWQNWEAYVGGYAFAGVTLWGYPNVWLWGVLFLMVGGLSLPFVWRATNRKQKTKNEKWKTHAASLLPTSYFRLPSSVFLLPTPYSLLPTWLLGALLLFYLAVLERGTFNVRYSSFVTPALYLLLGMAMANWARLWRPLWVVGIAVLLVGFVPAIRADLYDPRFAREDVGDLADWLRQEAGPEDIVFVDQKYPFGFYYERYTIAAESEPVGAELAPARYLFVDLATIDQRLTSWAGDAERVFWVQWFESDTDPRNGVRFLLDSYGERAGERHFQGYTVNWWRLMPPTSFVLPSTWTDRTVRFANAIETMELAFPTQVSTKEKIAVGIRWRRVPGGLVEQPLKARVALYDAEGNRLRQVDERLLNDRHRLPAEWGESDQPLNLYLLDLSDDLAEGDYELRLLVYDAETLAPLSVLDEGEDPTGVEAVLGIVTIMISS